MRLKIITMLATATLASGVAAASSSSPDDKIKVACVGNSITYGYTLPDRTTQAWPFRLAEMLGPGYEVGNFGKSSTTLLAKGHFPYINQPEYAASLDFKPDIVVIHLGVNDTDPRNWPNHSDEFVTDYLNLIDSYRKVNPEVRIIIANLTPLTALHSRFPTGTRQWREKVNQAITQVADIAGVELTDFGKPLLDRTELLPDAVHPDPRGQELLARQAASAITGNYGGLKLNPIFGDGMVIQQLKPIKISGTSNAGDTVSVTLGKDSAVTVTPANGSWLVTLPPRAASRNALSLSVSTPDTTVTLRDILIGELWIASGQSNMAFTMNEAVTGARDLPQSADSLLRIFNMRGPLTNATKWSDETIAKVNNLEYYYPTQWEKAAPSTLGNFSAVAYYFARELRDSLDVPVGVICNAVGGAGAESFASIESIDKTMPRMLVNRGANDYQQPWVKQRMKENVGENNRHPYEPAYLFATGVRPLGDIQLAGVIWYQGESNAHNTELHEEIFPMMVESWRTHFNRHDLPFYFVQLSSLNRPSWPEFRDSQRRLARSVPDTWMAVSSDVGDSLDVHPRNKLPVGHRLARLALRNSYSRADLQAESPAPEKLTLSPDGKSLILTMSNADGLHTSDGGAPITFEVAAHPYGPYYPATARIISPSTIEITDMKINNPTHLRYGWQPFTRANLLNGSNLPASTFLIGLDTQDSDFDSGFDEGVSAAAGGVLPGGEMIVAGGCNFPGNPMAPGATKKFYRGIYLTAPVEQQPDWQLAGLLPEGLAYGVSASTPKGVFIAGGNTSTGNNRKAWLANLTPEGTVILTDLPQLPADIDNASCAFAGSKIYIAGGNYNGLPSNRMIALDLDNADAGWQELKPMPGDPRVQPVMAAATVKGKPALYIWGGFAGRHTSPSGQTVEPTLTTSGLCYDIASGKYKKLPAPEVNGEEISLGGGAAVSVDNRIVAIGGVNKDVFLNALRNQAPDYLSHPVEWYSFNPNVMVYDPETGIWNSPYVSPDLARAGALMIAAPESISVIGGELKPRIRTTRVSTLSF
ncbi:MAG: cyclically-permuted mutarotase family protein [Paramuribaculum sp.]|nr:cyclically-permuted mutarotase family protein [Paramuribaculum sp.]